MTRIARVPKNNRCPGHDKNCSQGDWRAHRKLERLKSWSDRELTPRRDHEEQRYNEEQIIGFLKQHEAGMPTQELILKAGICEQTFYRWKSKFGGMAVSDAKKLRGLEDENRRLKQLVAEQALEIQILKDVNSKKW